MSCVAADVGLISNPCTGGGLRSFYAHGPITIKMLLQYDKIKVPQLPKAWTTVTLPRVSLMCNRHHRRSFRALLTIRAHYHYNNKYNKKEEEEEEEFNNNNNIIYL